MEKLIQGLKSWSIPYTQVYLDQFERYQTLILEWNQKFNITAITDPEEMELRLFLDSLSPLLFEELEGVDRVLDVGTGGGFPGLPLKILRPAWEMTLLDSLHKRITFLEEVIRELGLEKISAIHGRAEELGRQATYRETYDLVVSRAVAPLPTLAEYCVPFVKQGGYFLAMKGSAGEEERDEAQNAMTTLGASYVRTLEVALPGQDWKPQLLLYQKMKKTPKTYPRAGGKPRNKPL